MPPRILLSPISALLPLSCAGGKFRIRGIGGSSLNTSVFNSTYAVAEIHDGVCEVKWPYSSSLISLENVTTLQIQLTRGKRDRCIGTIDIDPTHLSQQHGRCDLWYTVRKSMRIRFTISYVSSPHNETETPISSLPSLDPRAANSVMAYVTNGSRGKITRNGLLAARASSCFGSFGTGVNQFNQPVCVEYSDAGGGVLMVVDHGNHRVHEFDVFGSKIRTWGSWGLSSGHFVYPTSVGYSKLNGCFCTK